ncbi:ParB/RepB/Spo0J family partition protein [Veronia pacifica]|uniref:Probable chromosome-partitioning protein ParB n=1 Tax=Veronia pacifica TaxID=1080227 RepID=A0A1C3EFJ1_9GAMM|nr:ParB/RepB/Spo0J family partition protein [Veronia pacifica]ODA32016.1 chromosome partitioning protein ParB [Veronia pacifica]
MNATKRGLGKGLDALLATSSQAQARVHFDAEPEKAPSDSELQYLPIQNLQPGAYQPRQEMAEDALEELAESIRAQGIIQPLVVRQLSDSHYEIIAGERRWRAAKRVGLSVVPCLVRKLDDKAASAIALIENIQREDLNAMEEAQALERLVADFTLTHQQLADALGKSRTAISNLLRLNGLEIDVKTLLLEQQLDMGHARALLALDGDNQIKAARESVSRNLTVRQTESLVKKYLSPKKTEVSAEKSPESIKVEDLFNEKFGTPVQLSQRKNGSGKLVINFEQSKQLMQILATLGLEV